MKSHQRQSNIELLRIIAMTMVLILHANFLSLGKPTFDSIVLSPVSESLRIILQCTCIVAVNVFVMISGWFGIHPSIKGFCKFMWQVFFIVEASVAVEVIFFNQPLTIKSILWCFGLFDGGGWFVCAYIGLYILAPVLNAFINNCTLRQLTATTILFIIFEIIAGDTLSAKYILMGYSTLSFVGLYLLAACLRRAAQNISAKQSLGIFIISIIANAIVYFICSYFSLIALRDLVLNYINPLVIISAASLLLVFSKITPPHSISPYINFLSASCFAIYLLHVGTPYALGFYINSIKTLSCNYSGIIGLLMIAAFITAVFITAILIDQPRKYIWNKILSSYFK